MLDIELDATDSAERFETTMKQIKEIEQYGTDHLKVEIEWQGSLAGQP